MVWGKCNSCRKKLVRQNRRFVSNVFCSKECRVRYWKNKYGEKRARLRDKVVDEILDEYRKTLKKGRKAPPSDMPIHMPRLWPPERHYGMGYRG